MNMDNVNRWCVHNAMSNLKKIMENQTYEYGEYGMSLFPLKMQDIHRMFPISDQYKEHNDV